MEELCDFHWYFVKFLSFGKFSLYSSFLLLFGEHLYDHYFELFIRSIIYLHLIKDFFLRFIPCSFIWNIFLCFFIFLDSLC